ncbi:MAG TPA: hypothetical protein VLM05_05235 [Mycobacteriales bacterium]|nr:hypothetical protein [Mycobacteriales bacterium]
MREPALKQAAPRIDRLRGIDEGSAALVDRLLGVARTGLPGMQMAEGTACFTRRFSPAGVVAGPEGWSLRYTAITLLGVRHLDPDGQRELLAGRTVAEVCDVLVGRLPSTDSVGDAALAVWAAAACGHDGLDRALDRLETLDALGGSRFVVDLAWVVSALVAARPVADVERQLDRARSRLLRSLTGTRQLFGHVTGPGLVPRYRDHVGCFADQVYPIQALARLHASAPDAEALAAAERAAERICALQGPAGQWWWHYDARTGEVVEGYPVYSVHQHAMAPMALLDLADAGGQVDLDAIGRGLSWMVAAPETDEPLILDKQGLTVRKVARRDPRKLVRGIRAATTGLRPGLRLGALDLVWPAVALDRECRPYEFGWLLDCWLGGLTTGGRPTAPTGGIDGTRG